MIRNWVSRPLGDTAKSRTCDCAFIRLWGITAPEVDANGSPTLWDNFLPSAFDLLAQRISPLYGPERVLGTHDDMRLSNEINDDVSLSEKGSKGEMSDLFGLERALYLFFAGHLLLIRRKIEHGCP